MGDYIFKNTTPPNSNKIDNIDIYMDSSGLSDSSDSYDDDSDISEAHKEKTIDCLFNDGKIHRFRYPCGKINQYYGLKDHGCFGKDFRKIGGEWGTGPYQEWASMIVDEHAEPCKWIKSYPRDISGKVYKDDDGTIHGCKNCEAYGKWDFINRDIKFCYEKCLSCLNNIYVQKMRRIQRQWRKYKNIPDTFEWDWRQESWIKV